MRAPALAFLFLVAAAVAAAGYFRVEHDRTVRREAAQLTGGDPGRGRDAVTTYGCIACHAIPGFAGPAARVGPPLARVGARMYVGGAVENRPENLIHFLREPRSAVPNGAMPNLHVTEADAQDLAAFLYTLQ